MTDLIEEHETTVPEAQDLTTIAHRLANAKRHEGGLTPLQFEAFLLRCFDRMEYADIAVHMSYTKDGVRVVRSQNAVRILVCRALAKIRQAAERLDAEEKEGPARLRIDYERGGTVISAEDRTPMEAWKRMQRKLLTARS